MKIHSKVLAALQVELQNRYEVSSSIKHKGERGRSRETTIAEFLRENLPTAYGVGTGELFSFSGEDVSPQCDIIVYDNLRTPIFGRTSSVQQIPIEGSFAVIEVKSILDTAALRDAEKKFAAIRKLWRSTPNSENGEEGPHYFLFGFKMLASEKACLKSLTRCEEEDWSIVSLDSGISVWTGPQDHSEPAVPFWLESTIPENEFYETLSLFLFSLLGCCDPKRSNLNYHNILVNL